MNKKLEIQFKNFGGAIAGNAVQSLNLWKEIEQYDKPFEIIKTSSGHKYHYLINLECKEAIHYFEEYIKGNYLKNCSLYLNVEYKDSHGLNYIPTIPIATFLQDLFLACTLSSPGALNLVPNKFISNIDQEIRLEPLYSDITEVAYDICTEWGWANFEDISFAETWEWLAKTNYLNSLVAISPPAKACSLIIELSGSGWLGPNEILSTSIVLESLLTSSKTGVAKQIRDRLNLIFGEPSKHKKWVTKYYDERSKIIHGDAKLPRAYAEVDFDDDVEKLYLSCTDYVYRALGITIALLRILIKNQAVGFDFKENYSLLTFD